MFVKKEMGGSVRLCLCRGSETEYEELWCGYTWVEYTTQLLLASVNMPPAALNTVQYTSTVHSTQ